MQMQLNFQENICQKSDFQTQLDEMYDSMGKVRRKLFAEMTEMKKMFALLKLENEQLKCKLQELKPEKVEWEYLNHDYLFEVKS